MRLCLQESGDLLYVLCWDSVCAEDIDQAVRDFVDRVIGAIQGRLRETPDAEIWRHGLRLFASPARLGAILAGQRGRFAAHDPDLDPETMLGASLKSHFETMRRELQTEHSPHRLKVWEQIDRISRDIRGVNDEPSAVRSADHLQAVLGEIRHRYPKTRNLPRSIDTLESYFLEFSRFFQPEAIDDRLEMTLADERGMTADDLDFLENISGMKPDPLDCFQALPERHAQAFAAAHRLQKDLLPDQPIHFSSARAYYLNEGISKRQFYRLLRTATNLLIACLERKVQERS